MVNRSLPQRTDSMHNLLPIKLTTFIICCMLSLPASNALAEYGDIIINKTAEAMRDAEVDDVVFPHWFHRIRFRCSVCHESIFILEAGANDIAMSTMTEKEANCGVCHNGLIAWAPLECERCHSLEPGWQKGPIQNSTNKAETKNLLLGKVGSVAKPYSKFMTIASGWHPLALTKSGLPLDKYGLVDWAKAVRDGIVNPLWNLDPEAKESDFQMRYTNILFESKGNFMPDVIFPHDIHSFWLQCKVCHETKGGAIFEDKAGANNITMMDIGKGKWCSRCHDKVAFPISDCARCHNQPKGAPIDKNTVLRTKPVALIPALPLPITIEKNDDSFEFDHDM